MKADIDKQGRLLLQPESQTEEAALFAWWEKDIDAPSIPRSRVLAFVYEQGRGGMNVEQFFAAAVEADAVLKKQRAMEIESVRIRQMGAEARAEMDAAMTPAQATEGQTYRLNVPLGVVQGAGNGEPVMTATEARSGMGDKVAAMDEELERFMVRIARLQIEEFFRRHQR